MTIPSPTPGPWTPHEGLDYYAVQHDALPDVLVPDMETARLFAAAPALKEALEGSVNAHEQTLSTLEWAQANVPGTNLRADILLQRAALDQARAVLALTQGDTDARR